MARQTQMKFDKSTALYQKALQVMVGGVSSPARAFKAVGGNPLFISRGEGPRVFDADGNEFIDYVCSWGALILGHAHPDVVREAVKAIQRGSSFGAPTEYELSLAEKACSSVPSMENVRFVNSGTEATMSALRLARGFTKRKKFVKFEGCYHGHADSFLTKAGSGLATFDTPDSEGLPSDTATNAITLRYNDLPQVEAAFQRYGNDIAAVIVEPVAGNMGVIPPEDGFLEGLRGLCTKYGSLLILDEVISGFRVSPGGAQSLFSVRPDITCLGKIIGGGFPVGAYGARREIMELISPLGPVYQAGTLSGNPVAMAAGLSTLSLLDSGRYSRLEETSSMLEKGLADAARDAKVALRINRVGSMLGLFFSEGEVRNFDEVKLSAHNLFGGFFRSMLESGVYLPPSPFETIFVSSSHSRDDISRTIEAAGVAFKRLHR